MRPATSPVSAAARAFTVLLSMFAGAAAAADCEVVQLSAGPGYACALRADGSVDCWGRNLFGGLDAPAGSFTQIASGGDGSCGLHADGSVECWGWDVGTPPAGPFVAVASGGRHACGIRDDASIECWGDDNVGQATPPPGTFVQLSLAYSAGCAVRTDGTLACWGENSPGIPPPPGTFVQVSSAPDLYHTPCALRANGSVVCWNVRDVGGYVEIPTPAFSSITTVSDDRTLCGIEADGTVGCTRSYDGRISRPVSGKFTRLSDTCGIRSGGTVECWGRAQPFAPPRGLSSVVVGENHTNGCGIEEGGWVRCWGSFEPPLSGEFTQLASGEYETCGLRTNGAIKCWSVFGGTQNDNTPVGEFTEISGGCGLRASGFIDCWSGVVDPTPSGLYTHVAANQFIAGAIRPDGTVHTWVGTGEDALPPPSGGTFVRLAMSSGGFACGIHSDHTLECWALFADMPPSFVLPIPPPGTFDAIALGVSHACGIRTDGTLACWGENDGGQASPPAGTFVEVAARDNTSCATASDGVTLCWGDARIARPSACVACGDGVLEAIEACDDGNAIDDDTCTNQCELACPAAPLTGCRVAASSSLSIRDSTNATGDGFRWKWKRGTSSLAELSSPVRPNPYLLCAYPDSGPPAHELVLPIAAGWELRSRDKGYIYEDSTRSFSGVDKVKLTLSSSGKASWDVHARGEAVPEGLLPAGSSYVVQLVDVGTGICWQSEFASGTNKPGSFKAKD